MQKGEIDFQLRNICFALFRSPLCFSIFCGNIRFALFPFLLFFFLKGKRTKKNF